MKGSYFFAQRRKGHCHGYIICKTPFELQIGMYDLSSESLVNWKGKTSDPNPNQIYTMRESY